MTDTQFGRRAFVWGMGAAALDAATPKRAEAQTFVTEVIEPAGTFHHKFGDAVAVDGNTLVTGDHDYILENTQGTCIKERGAIAIYKKNAWGQWAFSQRFRYPNPGTIEHELGKHVAIKGNLIVAAAPRTDETVGPSLWIEERGALMIYRRSSSSANFTYVGRVFPPGTTPMEHLGRFVPITTNGNYIAATWANTNTTEFDLVHIFRVTSAGAEYRYTVYPPTLPSGGRAFTSGVHITSQDKLIVVADGYTRPYAFQLSEWSYSDINTSSLASSTSVLSGVLGGDGNTVAFSRRTSSGTHSLGWASFNSGVFGQSLSLPSETSAHKPARIAVKSSENIFVQYPTGSGALGKIYRLAVGSTNYTYLSNLSIGNPGTVTSFATNGAETFYGVPSKQHDANPPAGAICGGRYGSIFVHRW